MHDREHVHWCMDQFLELEPGGQAACFFFFFFFFLSLLFLRLLLRGCGVCVCVCGCGTVWARKVPVVSAGSCHGHTKGGGGWRGAHLVRRGVISVDRGHGLINMLWRATPCGRAGRRGDAGPDAGAGRALHSARGAGAARCAGLTIKIDYHCAHRPRPPLPPRLRAQPA
jgi:hypothetical protein